jgi:predicted CXXCH cytochrome family protein
MRLLVAIAAVLALPLVAAAPAGADDKKLAPLPRDQATVVHGPYEQGACDTCHERSDAGNPGTARVTNETCLACHDDFAGKAPVKIGKNRAHPSVKGSCIDCHNPHNSRKKKLLL